jgi:hypothetical protein
MRILRFAASAAVIVAVLAACSGSKSGDTSSFGTGDPKLAAASPGGTVSPFLTDGAAVQRALGIVQTKYGGTLRLTSIGAHAMGGLTLDVQPPKNPSRIERYLIPASGSMVGPIPVKLIINGAPATTAIIEQLVFDPATISFARLAPAVREAINRSKLTDGRVNQWGLDGAHKKIYMIVVTQSDHRTVLLDNQLHVVQVMQQ